MRWMGSIDQKTFAQVHFSELLSWCQETHKNTQLVPVEHARHLMLHPKTGQTVQGLRFNLLAFRQACEEICAGLHTVVADLSESCKALDLEDSDASVLQIYNAVVSLVGDRLSRHRFVLDTSTSTIVGIVSRKYQYISNYQLLQMGSKWFRGPGAEMRMLRAKIYNRDLFVLGMQSSEAVKVGPDLTFRQGIVMYNSETTRRAVFCPRAVFDSQTKSFCFQPADRQNRMAHVKSKYFESRLEDLVFRAFQTSVSAQDLISRAAQLSKSEICPVAKLESVAEAIKRKLTEADVNVRPTDYVLDEMAKSRPTVTQWDLYRSLVLSAERFNSSERQLRMLAFTYLMKGQLSVRSS